MKALVFDGRLLYCDDYPVPTPAPGEVLVQVQRAGICATDIEITKGYMDYRGVLGHEFVGSLPDGSRVVGEINAADGTCDTCIAVRRVGSHWAAHRCDHAVRWG